MLAAIVVGQIYKWADTRTPGELHLRPCKVVSSHGTAVKITFDGASFYKVNRAELFTEVFSEKSLLPEHEG